MLNRYLEKAQFTGMREMKMKTMWIKDLTIRLDTIKLSKKKKIGRALSDINHSNIFSDPLPRVMKIKTKNKQMEPNKTAKVTLNKRKR